MQERVQHPVAPRHAPWGTQGMPADAPSLPGAEPGVADPAQWHWGLGQLAVHRPQWHFVSPPLL